jgi:uncharacterized protein YbjT (DUF2867 family)
MEDPENHKDQIVQKVLVTGATGLIGIELSRCLAERGLRPRLMVGRALRDLMLRSLDAEIMQADIPSPDSLRRILKGIDTVVHLGARAAFEPLPATVFEIQSAIFLMYIAGILIFCGCARAR